MFDCALLRQEEKSVWESVKQPLYNIHINSLCWVQSKINLLPYERLFYVSQNKVQEIIKIAPGKWLKKCSISGFHVVKEANCTISIENNNNNGDKNSNALTPSNSPRFFTSHNLFSRLLTFFWANYLYC